MSHFFDPLPRHAFDLLMIDPPWEYVMRSALGETAKSAQGQYACMSLADIMDLPVADLCMSDATLWCWATHPMLHIQYDVVKAWGFEIVTSGVWIKRTRNGHLAFGTGYCFRCASEPVIIARRGQPRFARNVRSAFEGPLREHSRKPDEAYRHAERLVPWALRRADIFARETRPGWTAWGNEAGKFDGAAP